MPRSIDLTPQNLQLDHNPNHKIGMSAAQAQNFLDNRPALIAAALKTAINQMLTDIDSATGLNLLKWAQAIENLLSAVGHPRTGDLVTDFMDWLSKLFPNLFQRIFGSSTGIGLVGGIPAPAVRNVTQNLQPVFDFPDVDSVNASGQWQWDGTVDHTGTAGSGSAMCVSNGILQALRGIPGAVQPAQVVTLSGWVMWSGLAAASGTSPIQLQVIPGTLTSDGVFVPGTPVTPPGCYVTSPAASGSWTQLTGTYTVPSTGVDAVQMRLVVTADASSGFVWFDDCQPTLTGGWLSVLSADRDALNADRDAKRAARQTYNTAVKAAIAAGGGWATIWAAIDAAKQAEEATLADITASEVFTWREFFSSLLGVDSSSGKIDAGNVGGVTIGTITDSIENHIQNIVDAIAQAINGGAGQGNDPGSIITNLQSIPQGNVAVSNAAALTTVTVVGSGAGAHNTTGNFSGHAPITWTDTIPTTADYVVVVCNVASTNGSGASCSITSPSTIALGPLVSESYSTGSPSVIIFGLANPPTGSVTFHLQANEAASVVTLIAGTSISLSGVGSVQDIAYESSATNLNPSLSTAYASPALVINGIGTFGTSGDVPTLSSYSQTQEYHSGAVTATSFTTDLIAGVVASPSSPTFSATMSTLTSNTSFGNVAIALNPSSSSSVIGHGFRQHRNSATDVSASNGYNPFPSTFFDTLDFNEYSTVDATTNGCKIIYTGHYSVSLHVMQDQTSTSHLARAILYKNGSIVRNGPTLVVTQRSADTFVLGATWNVYCQDGDLLQPGYWVSRAVSNIFTGDSTGAKTFWEVSLTNRSLM